MHEILAPLFEKHYLLEILRKISKTFKEFLRTLKKNIKLAYFLKKLRNHALFICEFGRKIFEGPSKNHLSTLLKCISSAIFQ